MIDSEGDNRPGITLTSQGLTGSTTLWGVFADRSSYVSGKVGSAGAHTALYQSNQQGAQYGCEGALCGVPSNPTYCSIEYNRAQFARLDGLETPPGGWGCAAVVERLTSLFSTTAPAFPAHCKP